MLVSLNIDAVLQETTIYRRRQKLRAMNDSIGLGDAYGATLDRIKGQGGERARLGMAALMWISLAERPLKADELCHALSVEIGSPNLNTDNIPSISTLIACCQGLIVVEKEASAVRSIHFTLQEYLRAHPELFGAAHSTMAETCLSYLNSRQVKAISTSPSPDLQGTPFLEYSSLYWGVHAKRDLSDCAKRLAFSVPNRPVRTPGPWRPIVPSVPGRVGKDGQARRPSFVNTAGLGVDGRALQSFLEMVTSGRYLPS